MSYLCQCELGLATVIGADAAYSEALARAANWHALPSLYSRIVGDRPIRAVLVISYEQHKIIRMHDRYSPSLEYMAIYRSRCLHGTRVA